MFVLITSFTSTNSQSSVSDDTAIATVAGISRSSQAVITSKTVASVISDNRIRIFSQCGMNSGDFVPLVSTNSTYILGQ